MWVMCQRESNASDSRLAVWRQNERSTLMLLTFVPVSRHNASTSLTGTGLLSHLVVPLCATSRCATGTGAAPGLRCWQCRYLFTREQVDGVFMFASNFILMRCCQMRLASRDASLRVCRCSSAGSDEPKET